MAVGLSTYAFKWRASACMSAPVSLYDMLDETAALGGDVFQVCDFPEIERLTQEDLGAFAKKARELGIVLELGTRGIRLESLNRYLDIAATLEASVLRTMFNDADSRPTPDQALEQLRAITPRLESQGVTLALETYEQVSVKTLMNTIEYVDSPCIGICLDPGNCVAALDMPLTVIESTADRVVNLHIKDFVFTREDSWIGFQLTGCPLGEGQLPLEAMLERVAPSERGINLVVEHWLGWQGSAERTAAVEADWSRQSMNILRRF